MEMEIPSCLEEYEPELVLTVDDRRKLIKGLARTGPRSIGKFIDKHSTERSSGIAKLVRRLREKLEHQMKLTRERIEVRFKHKKEQTQQEFSDYLEPVSDDVISDKTAMGGIDHEIDSRLSDILSQDDTLNLIVNLEDDDEETRMGFWSRLRDAFRRAFRYLVELFQRFIEWLRGKREKTIEPSTSKRRLSNILLRYPSGAKMSDDIDGKLDNALATNTNFKRAIERDISANYARKHPGRRSGAWTKHFKRDYHEQARKVINQRIKRAIKREQRKLAHEFDRKRRRIKQKLQDKGHQEIKRREIDSRLAQLEKQRKGELDKLRHREQRHVQREVKKALVSELEDAGYIHKGKKDELKITSRLIDRFAELVLSDELQKLPSKFSSSSGAFGISHGVYEKKKLQTSAESSRMDIVSSIVNARLAHPGERHIYDSDIITYKDMRSTISHVVLIFDKSGSMEENERLTAAKKSVLALYKAVKHRNPNNVVDFIAFDSTVKVMDILQAWRSSPSGFTNTGEALNVARQLIEDSHADHKLIYLITDGLPEAYTDARTGKPRAGDLEKSLSVAVREAQKLKKIAGLKLTIILLEPKEAIYTDAARTIAKAVAGDVIVTDPSELAAEMLMDYIEV